WPAQGHHHRRVGGGHRPLVLRLLDDRQPRAGARLHPRDRLPAAAPAGPVHRANQEPGMTNLNALAARPGLKPRLSLIGIGVFAVLLLAVAPLVLTDHWLNNLGKYCCWAI